MRGSKDLQTYWQKHAQEELVLCTIVTKEGSGYRSVGAKKIVRANGDACGYLSGGCLDGDIVKTALEKWNNTAFIASFSTMSDEDRLMGYQTGCAGIIHILFEKLPDISSMHAYIPFGPDTGIKGVSVSLDPATLGQRTVLYKKTETTADCFIDPWIEPLDVYVVGCGANAHPFAELIPPLGWNMNFLDYRQGNIIKGYKDVQSKIITLAEIGASIPEGRRVVVVIMTHNYEADMAIIGQLNKKTFGYLGCVGPRKRFDQIDQDLEAFQHITLDEEWKKAIHAPAGLRKGRTPEDIAFSIIAEIQFKLAS